MISRQWRALARAEHAEDYVTHLRSETFPSLTALQGFVNASILRRAVPNGVEFIVITNWSSAAAIQAFAGLDVEAAVVPPIVVGMMHEFESRARHYEVLE